MTPADIVALARRFAGDAQALPYLDECLEPLARSCWPDVAWRFSRLTVDGCPVEFGVSSMDKALRITFEVAGPECSDSERLGRSLDILHDCIRRKPDSAMQDAWRDLQRRGRLRWGSWMGLRASDGVVEPKLYIEIPPENDPAPPKPLRGRVRMIGFDPLRERIETYVALPQIGRSELVHLLAGLDEDSRCALLDMIGELIGMPLDIALDWIGLGASLAESPSGKQLALFIRARTVRHPARKFRKLFAGNDAYCDWFDGRSGGDLPDHGVLTFIPRGHGRIEVRAGLSATSLMKPLQ